jgi:hypothetical protein
MTGVAHQQDLEKMALTQDYRFALSERQGQYDLERQRIRNIGRQQELEDRFDYERELYDYQLTVEQKDRESKIRQALSVIEHDETLTPEDRAESRRLLAYDLAGITPIPKRKDPSPGIDELVQFHEGTGASFLTDPSTGKLTEIKGTGISVEKATQMAINMNTTEEGGINWNNVERDQQRILGLGRGGAGSQQGAQGGQRVLAAPPVDERTQVMMDRIKILQGEGRDIGRISLKDAELIDSEDIPNIPDIPTAKAHLRVNQRELEVHREKPIARKIRPGVGTVSFNPRSGAGQKFRRERSAWEDKEKKLSSQVEKLKKHLEALQREDRLLRASVAANLDATAVYQGMRQ